jgi:molybdopterin/thiamine biosynthesis adenylyltransferase/rhodanese-related sulfurtransferase
MPNTHLKNAEEALWKQRYARQISLPQLGTQGQISLKNARVLIVGVGGLGSPAAFYLAAAGVGTLGLMDGDTIELSNLQRQILYQTKDVGLSKVQQAAQQLSRLNPDVLLECHPYNLTATNALATLREYDVVIDGSDNFLTRYLVHDACYFLGKPYVYGSVMRFSGQASVFHGHQGACYRCLFPKPPQAGELPSCTEGGVLGVVPGTIGTLQATEALKLILQKGRSLLGRLMTYDALEGTWSEFSISKDPNCPLCGDHPQIVSLRAEEDAVCRFESNIGRITVQEVDSGFLCGRSWNVVDVREPHELAKGMLPQALHIPLNQIVKGSHTLTPERDVVLYCQGGHRSLSAAQALLGQGFRRIWSLEGGFNAWSLSSGRQRT